MQKLRHREEKYFVGSLTYEREENQDSNLGPLTQGPMLFLAFECPGAPADLGGTTSAKAAGDTSRTQVLPNLTSPHGLTAVCQKPKPPIFQ